MELHPGVFVSNVMTDQWRPDPEVGGEMHVLVEEETAYVGMSRFTRHAGSPVLDPTGTGDGLDPRGFRADRDPRWTNPGAERRRHGVAAKGCGDQLAHDAAVSGDLVLRSTI